MPVLRSQKRVNYAEHFSPYERFEKMSESELRKYVQVDATPTFIDDIAKEKLDRYRDLMQGKIVQFNDDQHKRRILRKMKLDRHRQIYSRYHVTASTMVSKLGIAQRGQLYYIISECEGVSAKVQDLKGHAALMIFHKTDEGLRAYCIDTGDPEAAPAQRWSKLPVVFKRPLLNIQKKFPLVQVYYVVVEPFSSESCRVNVLAWLTDPDLLSKKFILLPP